MSFAEKTKLDINTKWRIDDFIPLDKSGTEQTITRIRWSGSSTRGLFSFKRRMVSIEQTPASSVLMLYLIQFSVLCYVLAFFPKIFTLSSLLVFQPSRNFPCWVNSSKFLKFYTWCKVPPKCSSTLVSLWFYSPAVF